MDQGDETMTGSPLDIVYYAVVDVTTGATIERRAGTIDEAKKRAEQHLDDTGNEAAVIGVPRSIAARAPQGAQIVE